MRNNVKGLERECDGPLATVINSLVFQNRFDEALIELDALLKDDEWNPDIYVAISLATEGKGRIEEAIQAMQFAILLDIADPLKYIRLGELLLNIMEAKDATDAFKQAIHLEPTNYGAYIGLSRSLHEQDLLEEALEAAKEAIRIDSLQIHAHELHGAVLHSMGLDEEAIAAFSAGLDVHPDSASLHTLRGTLLLACQRYREGWDELEWRFKGVLSSVEAKHSHLPAWDGKSQSQRVFIWREQGLGDEILYLGLLHNSIQKTQQFIIEVDERLIPLARRSFPGCSFISSNEAGTIREGTPAVAMGSVCKYLNLDSYIAPRAGQYLVADPRKVEAVASQLEDTTTEAVDLRIGLSWKSFRQHLSAYKSVPVNKLSLLFQNNQFQPVNLQYSANQDEIDEFNKASSQPMACLDINIRDDIDQLASLIECCDIVITVSNVTAHIASALGKETWVLLPRPKGLIWYWLREGETVPWYPNTHLFRQKASSNWDEVIERVRHELCARTGMKHI
ncbi:hypothetical protein KBY97_08325 [Synechococcus sp. ATX 2A4]|uniref:tetratricopeptide repeat protein n=1 Tax=Synechococcus sp. ATX 2A4 TaxID=2823727 RepID=UPI0020CE966D|nr:tetratricopeptide repeat protein [Synechococcus sp. ATX 2A4]MCP9885130.1 hypothetical protein [Synechococcus sp. ATX 2A4]